MEMIHYFQTNPDMSLVVITLLSLCVGSFLNVVIFRLPVMLNNIWRKECHEFLELPAPNNDSCESFNLVVPRSRCPQCKQEIKAWHNIPIISYLLLKGKCAACYTSISARYPLVELTTALLSFVVAWHFGPSLQMAFALVFTWILICLTLIDYDHQILPDTMTLGLLWLGILANLLGVFTPLSAAIIGALAGYLSLWSFATLFKLITGKQGMGHGDFKLLAALGAWLGWQCLPFIILCSTLVGAMTGIALIILRGRDRQLPIPFGPFLAAAGWVALLWGQQITHAYINYAGF